MENTYDRLEKLYPSAMRKSQRKKIEDFLEQNPNAYHELSFLFQMSSIISKAEEECVNKMFEEYLANPEESDLEMNEEMELALEEYLEKRNKVSQNITKE